MFTVSITIDQVIDALADYISPFVGNTNLVIVTPIIRAQVNRVTYPLGNFVQLTELFQYEIETPTLTYSEIDESISVRNPSKVAIQVDFYGEQAGDYCRAFLSAFRSIYCYDRFPANIKPLYYDTAKQMPLIDDEEQYKTRWTTVAYLQYNPTVIVNQDYPDELKENLFVNVDTTIG